MKTTVITLASAVALLIVVQACQLKGKDREKAVSADKVVSTKIHNEYAYDLRQVEVEGHTYLVFTGIKSIAVLHSESCQCKRR